VPSLAIYISDTQATKFQLLQLDYMYIMTKFTQGSGEKSFHKLKPAKDI